MIIGFGTNVYANKPTIPIHIFFENAIYFNGTWYICDLSPKTIRLNGVRLEEHNPDFSINTCIGGNANFTYCMEQIPYVIPEPSVSNGITISYQPKIEPGNNPFFKLAFNTNSISEKLLRLEIKNFANRQESDIWYQIEPFELLQPQVLVGAFDLLANAENNQNLLPLCNPWNDNIVFTSKERLQDEIWEYTSDNGVTWTTITNNPSNFFIEELADNYVIKSTTSMHTIADYTKIGVRTKIKISDVNEDNIQNCRTQDVVVWQGKFEPYPNAANYDLRTNYCLNEGAIIDILNYKSIDKPETEDWEILKLLLTNLTWVNVPIPIGGLRNDNTRLIFTPTTEGYYTIKTKIRDACGSQIGTLSKFIEVRRASQVAFTKLDYFGCDGAPQTIIPSGSCSYTYLDASNNLPIPNFNTDRLYVDPNLYPNGIRLIGEDCNTGCSSETLVSFNLVNQPIISLKPICKEGNNYLIGPVFEDGSVYRNDKNFFTVIETLVGNDKDGWLPMYANAIEQNSDGEFNVDLNRINFNSSDGISRHRLIIRNDDMGVCSTLYFSLFKKELQTNNEPLTFDGLFFVCGKTRFVCQGSTYNNFRDIIVKENAKLYFMHNQTDFENIRNQNTKFSAFSEDPYNIFPDVPIPELPDYVIPYNFERDLVQWSLHDGVNLRIEPGAELTSECKMWLGIRLTNGYNKNPDNLFCKIGEQLKAPVKISNALFALRLVSSSSQQVPHSVLFKVENTQFFNNMCGVIYEGNPMYEINEEQQSRFCFNTFDSDSKSMLPPFHPQTIRVTVPSTTGGTSINENREFEFVSQNHFVNSGFSHIGSNQANGTGLVVWLKGSSTQFERKMFFNNTFNNSMEAIAVINSNIVIDGNVPFTKDNGIYLDYGHNNVVTNSYRFAIGYRAWPVGFATSSNTFPDRISKGCRIKDFNYQLPQESATLLNSKLFLSNPLELSIWNQNNDPTTLGIYSLQESLVFEGIEISGPPNFEENTIGIKGTFKSNFPDGSDDFRFLPRVSNSRFSRLGKGLEEVGHRYWNFNGNVPTTYSFHQNYFDECKIGIHMPQYTIGGGTIEAKLFVSLKCNIFKERPFWLGISKGVVIGNSWPALDFGYYRNSIQRSFSSNVWPTASGIDRSVQPMTGSTEIDVNDAWQSPTNWTSILKEGTLGQVNYFRYKNEFVGQVFPNNPSLLSITAPNQALKAYTSANSPQPTDPNYELVCDGSEVGNEVFFPSTLIRKNDRVSLLPTHDFAISESNNEVNITSNSSKTIYEVQISDLLGRVVGRYGNINSSSFTIPAATLQKGVYIISLIDSEGKLFTSKLQR